MFDFDESFELSPIETTLAFQCALCGLSKLTDVVPPDAIDIEDVVVQGYGRFFSVSTEARVNEFAIEGEDEVDIMDAGLKKAPFIKFCLDTPELISWIDYFDDLHIEGQDSEGPDTTAIVSRAAANTPPAPSGHRIARNRHYVPPHFRRSGAHTRQMNPSRPVEEGEADFTPQQSGAATSGSWREILPYLAPRETDHTDYSDTPIDSVVLDWAYGFNGHSSRQTLYYSARGALVYPAGSVVVIHDAAHNKQRHFTGHNDLITCLKLFHNDMGDTIVASGECGKTPVVLVWECDTRRVLSALKGFHSNALIQLDFSPDRSKLVTLGMDIYYCLAVYDWRKGVRLWSARTSLDPVYDVHFLSDRLIASCGRDHVTFWSQKAEGTYGRFRGLFGAVAKKETMWCVSSIGDNVVTGSESGTVYMWEGRNLVKGIKAHEGRVNAMYLVSHKGAEPGLVTVCSAGMVQIWNEKIEIRATFRTNLLNPIEKSIVSVCWDIVMQKLLLGFRSCEIFEMSSTEGRNAHFSSVVAAHYDVKVSHVTTHPTRPELFCTCGADRSVRVYDMKQHKQIHILQYDTQVKCSAYSGDGKMLIVGLGTGISGAEDNKEGAYVVYNSKDLSRLHHGRLGALQIADIKTDPKGKTFAIASLDGSIYIFDIKTFAVKFNCRGHRGGVINVDYSTDGRLLRSNCDRGDLVFWDVKTGMLLSCEGMGDVQWRSLTCKFSYETQMLWTYEDINYNNVCRSNNEKMIVSADSCGLIKIFPSPCNIERPTYQQAKGHAAEALSVCFTCNDAYVLSTGGLDGCVFQWAVNAPDPEDEMNQVFNESVMVDITHLYAEMAFEGEALVRSETVEGVMSDRMDKQCEFEEMAEAVVLPQWREHVVIPSKVPPENNTEPACYLELECIAGFACDRSRDSLKYAHSGDIVFLSAAMAAVMSAETRKQSFYMDHSSTVTAMAVHPLEDLLATGELGEKPSVRVWNSVSKKTLVVLEGCHSRMIRHLDFSRDGTLLAVLGGDDHHRITVYFWKHQQIVAQSLSIYVKSFQLSFEPRGNGLVQCGDGLIRFWTVDGINMRYKDAVLAGQGRTQPFLCSAWRDDSNVMVGTADGHLYVFDGYVLDEVIPAHNGTVNCISAQKGKMCTGGSDGLVKVWSLGSLECMLTVDIHNLSGGVSRCDVRCIELSSKKDVILVGTLSKEIFEMNASTGADSHGGPLMDGHCGEELWGLSAHPSAGEYCTVGDDSLIRIWNVEHNCSVRSKRLESPARCCVYSHDGEKIAVGTVSYSEQQEQTVKVVILNSDSLETTSSISTIHSMVTGMKYSPDGKLLVCGCLDGQIHIFAADKEYNFMRTVTGHDSYISHVDFSVDSRHFRINCGGYEAAFYKSSSGEKVQDANEVRDVEWHSHNCPMTWEVQGAWPLLQDGTDITSCDCRILQSSNDSVLLTGDNYGRVQLFRYPAQSARVVSKRYRPSSNVITATCFVKGGAYAVSISGSDNSILKWRCVVDAPGEQWTGEEPEDDEIKALCIPAAPPPPVEENEEAKMWLMTLVEPTDTAVVESEVHLQPPNVLTELTHVFGLCTASMRSMIRYNLDGDIIYPASKYVCVYSKRTNAQIFYKEHQNHISCLTVSSDGKIAASVEECARPSIRLWDACTTRVVKVLPVLHRQGLSSMQFSADNTLLLSVGKDRDRSIALWESLSGEWTDARLKAWSKGSVTSVTFASFYQHDSIAFVSGGEGHIKFWQVSGRCMNPYNAEYNNKESKIGNVLCGAKLGQCFVSGNSAGKLHVWKGKTLERAIPAHEDAVRTIWSDDVTFVSGSADGTIKIWTIDMSLAKTISMMDTDLPPRSYSLVSVDCITDRSTNCGISTMLVGTKSGDICEVSVYSESITLIQESHAGGELWGLSMHPFDPDVFATSGDDCTVRVWSITLKRVIRKAVLECTSRAVSWSLDGKLLIVGLGGANDGVRQRKDGGFVVFEAATLIPIFEGRYVSIYMLRRPNA
jgi:WD40 repeat protein